LCFQQELNQLKKENKPRKSSGTDFGRFFFVSKAMIEKFILDEQEHYDWVKQHLNLIREIGYGKRIVIIR